MQLDAAIAAVDGCNAQNSRLRQQFGMLHLCTSDGFAHGISAGTSARAPGRTRAVVVRAVAAPAKEAPAAQPAQGPIIMNGQVLHSSTAQQLEIVRGLGKSGHLEKQVRSRQVLHVRSGRSTCWQC
jgi:hypothetical protein